MKLTVCQLPNRPSAFQRQWEHLAAHVLDEASDLVLLPEMPFHPWFPLNQEADLAVWDAAVAAHDRWLKHLSELAPAVVLGSRPVNRDGRRLNEGFVWDAQGGYRQAHHKYHLPDEEGFWEGSWYHRGEGIFNVIQSHEVHLGFMICTDLWFMEHARSLGKQGAHILAVPRATPASTLDKWLVGGQAAAVVSGSFCISSNKVADAGEVAELGGRGWIIDPDGSVLATTSAERPVVTVDVEPETADRAKKTYPRYVKD